jgi:hypothetical protein
MYALPAASIATPATLSRPLPPRYVEYRSFEPVASSFAAHASDVPPPYAGWSAPCKGKSFDDVKPAMYTFPAASTAIAFTAWTALPPRYVECTSVLPSGLIFETKALSVAPAATAP